MKQNSSRLFFPLTSCLEPARPALQIEDWFYLAEGRTSVRDSTIDQNLLLLDGAPAFTPTPPVRALYARPDAERQRGDGGLR